MPDFVFLRPWAFWFLVPVLLFAGCGMRSFRGWFGVVDGHLLPSLILKGKRARTAAAFIVLFLIGTSAVLAMAGIALKGKEQTLYRAVSPAVIVIDLSLSMRTGDVPPDRLSRAVFKAHDLLGVVRGMPAGLIVFSDEPYSLLPTTTDEDVLKNVLPLLSSNLMPSQGSRLGRALEEAQAMLASSGAAHGDIFLLTDGGDDVISFQDEARAAARKIGASGNRLFILGVGTAEGAPLVRRDGGFITDRLGNPVRHALKEAFLKKLALDGQGAYASVSAGDGRDIAFLEQAYRRFFGEYEEDRDIRPETSREIGFWFLLPPLLFFPFAFARGRFFLPFLLLAAWPVRAETPFVFMNAPARAEAALEAGDEDRAVEIARENGGFRTLYNIGTRLIHRGSYGRAAALLSEAAALEPENEDAAVNLEIARRLSQKPPENNPPSGNPEAPDTPDASGEGEGESEGGNNLNQNNNNSEQHNENKENSSDNSAQNPPPEGSGGGSRGAEDENVPPEKSEGAEAGGHPPPEGRGGENAENFPRIQDDPTALLKQKIMFLYQSKRYPEETVKGAPW